MKARHDWVADRPEIHSYMSAFDLLVIRNSRKALVVAHPDDESLFFAGIVLRYPGDWTILCCSTPQRDPIRAWKFYSACEILGARGKVMPHTETRNQPLAHLEKLDLSEFDLIVTHGKAGEYGHPHHCQVHTAIRNNRDGADVLVSAYGRKGDAPHVLEIDLTPIEWGFKLDALKCYDHPINWGGKLRPTWDALIEEYGTPGRHFGFNLKRECYDGL
jgi:LmbE family N-acetylglucosaminyl deacetylase